MQNIGWVMQVIHVVTSVQVVIGMPSSEKVAGWLGVFSINGDCQFTLEPDEGIEVYAQFNPKDARAYETTIPVFVHGDLEKPHLVLEVSGIGVFPKLTFDISEVVLPQVTPEYGIADLISLITYQPKC